MQRDKDAALVVGLVLIGAAALLTTGLVAFSVGSVPPSISVLPANVQPISTTDPNCGINGCAPGLYHNIGGQPGSAQVMIIVSLGYFSEDLNSMTGGPPGYCNGGSCDTAVFNPLTGPNQYSPLIIDWGDGTTSQIQSYWLDCSNLYNCASYSPPGDGIGEGWAYGSTQAQWQGFYHTYPTVPKNYTVKLVPYANGPVPSVSYVVGTLPTTTASTSTTATTTYSVSTQTSGATTLVLPPNSGAAQPHASMYVEVVLFAAGAVLLGYGSIGREESD